MSSGLPRATDRLHRNSCLMVYVVQKNLLKNFMRNTMIQERLNDFSILSLERDTVRKVASLAFLLKTLVKQSCSSAMPTNRKQTFDEGAGPKRQSHMVLSCLECFTVSALQASMYAEPWMQPLLLYSILSYCIPITSSRQTYQGC